MEYTHLNIYIHEQSQSYLTKIKYSRLTLQTKEIKNCIYQLRIKLTKAQVENKTKAMKAKLTNMLRGKERKKRKKEQIYKVKQRQMKFIYIKDYLQGEKNSRKSKERNKFGKNKNRF